MTEEDWKDFTSLLEKYVEEFSNKLSKRRNTTPILSNESWINEVWEKLAELINKAANKTIPHKKIQNTIEEKQKQVIWNPRYRWIKQLRKIGRLGQLNLNKEIKPEDQISLNIQIKRINANNETKIQEIKES